MSDEERLKWLKEIEKDIFVCSLESTFVEDAKSCAIHSAIDALEILEFAKKELKFAVEHTKGETKEHYQRALNLLTKENK